MKVRPLALLSIFWALGVNSLTAQVPDAPFTLDADSVFLANFDFGPTAEDNDGPNLLKANLQFTLYGRYQTPCIKYPPRGGVGIYQTPVDLDPTIGTLEMWVKPALMTMQRRYLLSLWGAKSLDGDEHADLIVGGEADTGDPLAKTGNVYFSDGMGGLDLLNPAIFPSHRLRGVVSGDVNGDQIPDMILNQFNDDVIEIYLGPIAPGNKLDLPILTLPVPAPQGLSLVDLDGDGDRDLVAASFLGTTPPLFGFENDGAGNYTPLAWNWVGGSANYPGAEAIALGDVNKDGVQDILFGAFSDHPSGLLYGVIDKDGHYQLDLLSKGGFEILENGVLGVSMADLNQDGWLDLCLAQPGGEVGALGPEAGRILIHWNDNGDLSGAPQVIPAFGAFTVCGQSDMDNDGHLDIVVARWQSPDSAIYYGPDFTRYALFPVSSAVSFTVEDLNGDGFQDIFFRSSTGVTSPVFFLDEFGAIASTLDIPTTQTFLGMGVHASVTGSTPYGSNSERPNSLNLYVDKGEVVLEVSDREGQVYTASLPFPGPLKDVREGFHYISAEWSLADLEIQLTIGDPLVPTNVVTVPLDPTSVIDLVRPEFRIGTDRNNQFPASHWNFDDVRISTIRRSVVDDGGGGDS